MHINSENLPKPQFFKVASRSEPFQGALTWLLKLPKSMQQTHGAPISMLCNFDLH